jgi:AraC-like DNA-binding protein
MKYFKVPKKGDPSNTSQTFPNLNISLLCCRFWWLKNWESLNMSFPYWRIYWNKNSGSIIDFAGEITELKPDRIILIPPYTGFSSRLINNSIPSSGYCLEGGRVEKNDPEFHHLDDGVVLHLFIHFNLGMPYDFILPGIFSFAVNDSLSKDLEQLTSDLQENFEQISIQSSLIIDKIIILTVSQIPKECWNVPTSDRRIINVLRMIEDQLSEELSNHELARKANMAVNSFARHFRKEMGITPQQFIRQQRVRKAGIMLHHTAESIDEIARLSGFCDRFHMAKVFKENTNYSPAQYRRKFYTKN